MREPNGPRGPERMRLARALVFSAGVYAFVQHTGTWFTWLGALPVPGVVGRTRWADWIDIVTPYALLSAGAWVLHVGVARPRQWVLYFLGATSYCIGQGVHLAANSIGNDTPGDVAHLWDEVVSHYIIGIGVVLLVVALASTFVRHRAWPCRATIPVGMVVGATQGTNALEGGTAWFGLAVACALATWGWRCRPRAGVALLWAYLPAVAIIVGYGIWQGGFPQPSSVGIGF